MAFGYGNQVRSYDDYFAKALVLADDALTDALRVGSHAGALTLNVSASTDVLIPANATLGVDVLEADKEDGTFAEADNPVSVGLKPSATARTFKAGDEILKLALNDGKAYMKGQFILSGAITGSVDVWLGYAPR